MFQVGNVFRHTAEANIYLKECIILPVCFELCFIAQVGLKLAM